MNRKAKMKKRFGVFGLTGSPLHYGHLIAAENARIEHNLDKVIFVCTGNPPNKQGQNVLDAEDRHEMLVVGTSDNEYFTTSRVDINHGGNGYSLLTIQALLKEYGDDVELFYMTSSEYLDPDYEWFLPNWIGGKELFKLCTFLVFPRNRTEIAKVQEWAKLIPEAKIDIVDVPSMPLSSTMIRNWIEQGRSIWYTTPWSVQQIIRKKGHYRLPETPQPTIDLPVANPQRIGIYASQFNPINYTHLLFAEQLRQDKNLDRVLFITSAQPVNNSDPQMLANAEDRHDLVMAAVADNPYFEASRLDMNRNTASYALLTVEDIRRKYGPEAKLSLIVSAEYLNPEHQWHLPKWMGAEELFKQCDFLVFPTYDIDYQQASAWAKQIPQAKIEIANYPSLPISSEMIRQRVSSGQSIRYLTPYAVQVMINSKGLYKKSSAQAKTTRKC